MNGETFLLFVFNLKQTHLSYSIFQLPFTLNLPDPSPICFLSEKSSLPRDKNQTNKILEDKTKILISRLHKATEQTQKSPKSRQKTWKHITSHYQKSYKNISLILITYMQKTQRRPRQVLCLLKQPFELLKIPYTKFGKFFIICFTQFDHCQIVDINENTSIHRRLKPQTHLLTRKPATKQSSLRGF